MDAYVYAAAMICEDCAKQVMVDRKEYEGAEDSDAFPQGPYGDGGGEADSPQHCDICGVFLDNPLTSDGATYVRDAFGEYVESDRGSIDVLADWKLAYDYCWDDFVEITLPLLTEDYPLKPAAQARLAELEAI